jgi:hypothetical protein
MCQCNTAILAAVLALNPNLSALNRFARNAALLALDHGQIPAL